MSNSASARSHLGPSSSANGGKRSALVPTNNVTTGDGLTVRTRIDATLTVDDVMKQLCVSLEIKEPPSYFALRDDMDELVTNDNLRRKIRNKVNLKCVLMPTNGVSVLTLPQTCQCTRSRGKGNGR